MDKLEELFRNNRESFDRLDVEQEAPKFKRSSGSGMRRNLRLVAAALVLIGLSTAIYYMVDVNGGGASAQATAEGSPRFDLAEVRDANLLSPEGSRMELDPSQNKVTLVQFWSTTSAICTENNCYYFKPVYDKYKNKGFEIYAICLDQNKDKWIEEINKYELAWTHVLEEKGFESELCKECRITEVPTTFLIDQDGKVIAKNLNVRTLDHKLSQLLASN